jgi:hypothetical protein
MNPKTIVRLIFCLGLIIVGCSKDYTASQELIASEEILSAAGGAGATQVSGVGFFAEPTECNAAAQGADYAVRMTGDLEGCLYVFIEEFECSPSGTYREQGKEHFIGTYKGAPGTFWTAYKFEAKYEGCADNGGPLGAEIFGRCQHPLVKGSGGGVFAGATGRLDMKDDIAAGNFPYRGHIKF